MKKIMNRVVSTTVAVAACFCMLSGTTSLFAQENYETQDIGYEDPRNFDGVEIVTPETAVPLVGDVTDNLPNVEMGEGQDTTSGYNSKARSVPTEPIWKDENGVKSFYNGYGQLMYNVGSKYVIDVSEHNGVIDWNQVKNAGVDGAILRIGWGTGSEDIKFARNVSECNRLGIPYGVYLYSYAYDANFAYWEAEGTAALLKKYNVNLSFPIYYDIENFIPWKDDDGSTRVPPKSTAGYEEVIGTYISRMNALGYSGKVHVYSYRSMLNGVLNSSKIHQYVSWAAEYGYDLKFVNKYYSGIQGWQYWSQGSVPGIGGNVDLNCFGDFMFNAGITPDIPSILSNAITSNGMRFEGGYISGLSLGSDISGVINVFGSVGASAQAYNYNGSTVSGGVVKTGQRIRIEVKEGDVIKYYNTLLVVNADINGDGNILANDYFIIKKYKENAYALSDAFLRAADVNKDGKVLANDYFMIKKYKEGQYNIVQ